MSSDGCGPTLLVMTENNYSQRFVERLAVRDFDGMAAQLAPGAVARFLLPRGPEEQHGRDDIIRRFRDWFAAASRFDKVSTSDEATVGRRRLDWRFRVVRAGGSPELIEQVAFVNVGPDGIERLDLLCSGFELERSVPESCELQLFDAGNLGCADGLAEEFRRRMSGVPVGASLSVVVADPAAKEDLPPLARMLGHSVKSTHALADGRLTFTVERGR